MPTRPDGRPGVGLSPVDDPRVLLNSGGGDAVETAAKLARKYWDVVGKPTKVALLHREFSFHGLHGLGTELAGIRPLREGFGERYLNDFHPLPVNDAQALENRILELGADAGQETDSVSPLVTKSGSRTLSRWRHGFEPRWDYAGQRAYPGFS